MSPTAEPWSPSSWRTKPAHQAVTYPSPAALSAATAQLRALPPIVTAPEIHRLRAALARAARGEALVLQGGDCAELFAYCEAGQIDAKLKLLLQMSLVLVYGARRPVVRIGRIAGQYAKPRSSPVEKVTLPTSGGETEAKTIEVSSFRGDILNGYDIADRALDPERLVAAYWHSAATMNYARAQLASGMADLHSPMDWGLGHVQDEALQKKYARIVESIRDSLSFMRTVGADSTTGGGPLSTVDLYTSHEGLVLEYEEALVRRMKRPADEEQKVKRDGEDGHAYYATSAHFVWIGDRTRQLDGAHVEFFRGIANPVGVKVGPSMAADELARLLDVIDPDKEPGRVTLITRYGADKVEKMLGTHIEAVRSSGHVVVWQCDPMHGNTHSTATGVKTRSFAAIFAELAAALRIHRAHGSHLGGMHLELTGDAVTECVGGSEGLGEEDLAVNYTTFCDPRLNEKQALELAFLVADHFRAQNEA